VVVSGFKKAFSIRGKYIPHPFAAHKYLSVRESPPTIYLFSQSDVQDRMVRRRGPCVMGVNWLSHPLNANAKMSGFLLKIAPALSLHEN
jgi:hypothetical protein